MPKFLRPGEWWINVEQIKQVRQGSDGKYLSVFARQEGALTISDPEQVKELLAYLERRREK